jgi:Na+/H+-dicarboxylate symporter
VLPYFKIPEAAVALLLAVDQVLDMGRTGVNTIANAITVAVVAKWETPPDTNPKPEPA